MEVEKVKITPSLAREWLEQVPEFQRKIISRQVDKIKMAILRDEWRENGATIVFNREDKLIDGQHRLKAIMESGRSCYSLVAKGVTSGEQTFITIDDSEARELKDFLKCPNACGVASAAKWYWHFVNDDFPGRSKTPPISDMRKLVGQHMDVLVSTYQEIRKASLVCSQGSFMAAVLFYYRHIQKLPQQDRLTEFFVRLGSGTDLARGSSILALRNRCTVRTNETLLPFPARALILKALHAYLENRPLNKVGWDSTKEPFPELK